MLLNVPGCKSALSFPPGWAQFISSYLSHGQPLYLLAYVGLIVFFCFFYTTVVFNPADTADNLKKNGGFVPGIRPGKNTAEYLEYILNRLTLVGATCRWSASCRNC